MTTPANIAKNIANNIAETFAVLTPDLNVQTVAVTPELYEQLDVRFAGFKGHLLISQHEFSEDWPTWERHPAGDELVMLLTGRATLLMRLDAGDQSVELDEPGSYVVVPRNTWHTARVSGSVRMLFMTPGEGTENRPEP